MSDDARRLRMAVTEPWAHDMLDHIVERLAANEVEAGHLRRRAEAAEACIAQDLEEAHTREHEAKLSAGMLERAAITDAATLAPLYERLLTHIRDIVGAPPGLDSIGHKVLEVKTRALDAEARVAALESALRKCVEALEWCEHERHPECAKWLDTKRTTRDAIAAGRDILR